VKSRIVRGRQQGHRPVLPDRNRQATKLARSMAGSLVNFLARRRA
jgi:hypothetical protein